MHNNTNKKCDHKQNFAYITLNNCCSNPASSIYCCAMLPPRLYALTFSFDFPAVAKRHCNIAGDMQLIRKKSEKI